MKHRCRSSLAVAWLALLQLVGSAAFAGEQDLDGIRAAAEAAVRTRVAGPGAVFIRAATLDPRLHLPACPIALDVLISADGASSAQVPVSVRCRGAQPWSLYLVVRVEAQVPVLVARHALPRDAVPRVEDFSVEARRVPGTAAGFADAGALAGRRLRRSLGAGEVLALDALVIAPVIHRGEQVTLVARSGTMEIRVAAIALADGRPDDHIRVQNPASQRVIEGVVRAPGLVEVPL